MMFKEKFKVRKGVTVSANLKFAKQFLNPLWYGVYRNNFKKVGYIKLIHDNNIVFEKDKTVNLTLEEKQEIDFIISNFNTLIKN